LDPGPGATIDIVSNPKVVGGFRNIENLAGGDGQDTFNVLNGDLTGSIAGGGELDRINISANRTVGDSADGGAGNDIFFLEDGARITNGAFGGSGNDQFTVDDAATVTTDLAGEAGDDLFLLGTGAVLIGTFNGGGDAGDTIDGGDTGTLYRINAPNAGVLETRISGFSGVRNLVAGTGADTFRFESTGSLDGTIDAGDGDDSMRTSDGVDNVTLTGVDQGSAVVSTVTTAFAALENIDLRGDDDTLTVTDGSSLTGTLSGGTGSDLLVGPDVGATFNVTSDNSGELLDAAGAVELLGTGTVTEGFSSIENLTGGTGNDTFTLSNGVTLDGNLDGGGGTNILNLNSGASIGGTIQNVDVRITIDANSGINPGNAVDNILVQIDAGELEVIVNGISNNFFVPTTNGVNVVLDIQSQLGADNLTVDYSTEFIDAVLPDITLPGDILFNTTDGNDRVRLIGRSGVNGLTTTYEPALVGGQREIRVSNGASDQLVHLNQFATRPQIELDTFDSFNFTSPGAVDTVNLNAAVAPLGSQQALLIGGFSGGVAFETVLLSSIGEVEIDLESNDVGVNGSIDTVTINDGALQSNIGLTGLSISTGPGADVFNLNDASYLSNSGAVSPLDNGNLASGAATGIDLGSGTDSVNVTMDRSSLVVDDSSLTLSDSGVGALGTVVLTGLAGETGTFSGGASDNGFDLSSWTGTSTVTGNGGSDSLRAANADQTWNLVADDVDDDGVGPDGVSGVDGTVGTITFDEITDMIGGTGNDTFVIGAGVTALNSILDASGTNTIDLRNAAAGQNILLTGLGGGVGFAGSVGGLVPSFDGISNLQAPAGITDVLTGRDANANWTIGMTGGSYQDVGSGRTLTFSGIDSLTGGANDDAFTVDSNVTVDISGDVPGGMGDDSILIATDVTLTTTSTVTLGDGADSLVLASGARLVGNVQSDAGDDSFTLGDSATITGQIQGGADSDSLSFAGYASARSVALTVATANGFSGTEASVTGGFTGIDSLAGSTSATTDILTGLTTANALWRLDATNSYEELTGNQVVTFSNFDTLTGGVGVDDRFQFGVGVTESFTLLGNGSATFDVVEGSGNADAFSLTGTDAGSVTVNGQTSSFSNVQSLEGGAGNDTFAVGLSGSLTRDIQGGTGTDTLTGPSNGNRFIVSGLNAGELQNSAGTSRINTSTLAATGFSGVENLTGGNGSDLFTVNNGVTLDGAISGLGGSDTVTLNSGATVSGGVSGGADADAITVTGGGTVTANVAGDAGEDTLTLAGTTNLNGAFDGGADADTFVSMSTVSTLFQITGTDAGSVVGRGATFTNVENLTGAANLADTFQFQGGTLSGTIDGGATANAGENDTVLGSTLSDLFTITTVDGGTATVGGVTAAGRRWK